MNEITLREVCESLGVSRRAIQGYEKAELVIPSARNERGYLLYNEETRKRIETIKLFQEMGFSIKEIKLIIDAPKGELRRALEKQIVKMQEEMAQKEELICTVREFIRNL